MENDLDMRLDTFTVLITKKVWHLERRMFSANTKLE